MIKEALIDGDMLRYTLGFSCQELKLNESGVEELVAAPDYIWKYTVDKFVSDIISNSGSTTGIIYLTGKGNFREKIAKKKAYKANRKGAPKPLLYEEISTYLIDTWGAKVVDGMEADDAMAIEQTRRAEVTSDMFSETIICTLDKDLRMVQGWHYSWPVGDRIGEREPYFVDKIGYLKPKYHKTKVYKDGSPQFQRLEGTGLSLFYAQLLMGDATDNIPGCPKVGPKKAYEALKDCYKEMDMYCVVVGMYADAYHADADEEFSVYASEMGIDRDHSDHEYEEARDSYCDEHIDGELLEQAHLLWMVTELNKNGKPIMWTIPTGEEGKNNDIDL
jgi:5'-3' exonuclease